MNRTEASASDDNGRAPVTTLKGVGPALAATLGKLGIARVQDLWFHLPLRYEDRTCITPIRELVAGQPAQVEGVVEAVESGFRFRAQLKVALGDASAGTVLLRFFHFRRAQIEQLPPGTRLRCYGDVRMGAQGPEMIHPQYQRVREGTPLEARLTPVYPASGGLGQKRLRTLIGQALERLPDDCVLELIPEALRQDLGLGSLREALLTVHRPPPGADLSALACGTHTAQQRLAFEELLTQHIGLRQLRARVRSHRAPVLGATGALREKLLERLPFTLTDAQQRVSREILADLGQDRPMLRLVQGDVGSGKTVVAALAALTAMECGWQAAMMAPTELLAEQHRANLRAWLEPLGIEVAWLAGKVQGRARKHALQALSHGAQMVVGTHALMQQGVVFDRLGLVIIDEQHRFGVHQRLALRDKGGAQDRVPHQLVLTATPIPRTLAMSAYADLDVSAIDELPPGRTPVQTVAVSGSRRGEVIERLRVACAQGRQAYWVCTLIEESDQLAAQAAEVVHAELQAALPDLQVGLVHGRMKSRDRHAVMQAFKNGDVAVLVATTVIEVGVDVPNASLMVIENAERLGLAQLHQLRGRVGRGNVASSCVLLYHPPLSALARERLGVMRQTCDGFRIAEKDLQLRGPGEVLGTRQTGRMEFRVADLARDAHLLPAVQRLGDALLRDAPGQAERLVQRWVGSSARYADA